MSQGRDTLGVVRDGGGEEKESAFRDGPEFLAEPLGSQRVWVV